MAGQGGLDGYLRRFLVADFSDEHDVRVAAEYGAAAAGIGDAGLDVDLGDRKSVETASLACIEASRR